MEIWEIAAREEIRELIARYNVYGDAGRFDDLLDLFARDAVLEVVNDVHTGHDEIRSVFQAAALTFAPDPDAGGPVRHFTATIHTSLSSDMEATSRCYYAVVMAHGLHSWGRYFDRFQVAGGRWRFTYRRVLPDLSSAPNGLG